MMLRGARSHSYASIIWIRSVGLAKPSQPLPLRVKLPKSSAILDVPRDLSNKIIGKKTILRRYEKSALRISGNVGK